MSPSQIACPSCGEATGPGNFCGRCGKPLPGSQVTCNRCGRSVPASATYCGGCGAPLADTAAPPIVGNKWARRPDDFATRVEVRDVDGFFVKGLIVEEGTKAIFFTNGAYSGVVEAGRHDMGGLRRKILNVFSSKTTTAVLVDAGDVEVAFALDDLVTNDPLRLGADCRIVLRLDDPVAFFENFMKGQRSCALSAIEGFLAGEVRNAAQEFVATRSVADLSGDLAVKQALEQAAAAHAARTLERKGLQLVQVRVVNLRHRRLDELTRKVEEYWLQAEELRAAERGGAMVAGVERRVLDQETARALMQVEVFEERARVWQRARQAQMDDLRNDEAFRTFKHEVDSRGVLRQEEWDELGRAVTDRREDRELARRRLLETADVNHGAEIERLKLIGRLAVQGTLADAMRSEELKTFDVELEKQRRAAARKREDRQEDHEQDMREAGDAIGLLGRMKKLKAEEADSDQARELRAERDRHDRELDRIRALTDAGPDALVAFGPADRAAILAELRKTEALRGMTDTQILAMAAEGSPAVADALKAKFQGEAGREALERLVAEKDRHFQETHASMRAHADQLERLAARAMDTMRDTAATAARAGQPGMAVVTPGMGAGVVHVGPGAQAGGGLPMACPNCRRPVAAGQNFCENCGHKFIG